MNPAEAATLLTIAATFDNRKPDADAARAWALALRDIRLADAQEAVVQHFQTSREWLMPTDVIKAVRKMRSDRIAKAPHPVPPADLTEAQQRAWIGDARRRIADGEDPQQFQRQEVTAPRPIRELTVGTSLPEQDKAELRDAIRRACEAEEPEPTYTPAPRLREPEPAGDRPTEEENVA